MENQTLLSNLLVKVQEFVNNQNYCKGTWYQYHASMNRLRRFYNRNGVLEYSPEYTWECVLERRQQYETGEIAYNAFLYVWKVAELLAEYHSTGKIKFHSSPNWTARQHNAKFADIADAYEYNQLENGYSTATLMGARSDVRQFLIYMENQGCNNLSEICCKDISEYLTSLSKRRSSGISDSLTRLRSFFKYLVKMGLINENLIATLQLKTAIHKKVRFGFSKEESEKLLNAVDRDSPVGKRDYAILLLAKHTGLRAVDIVYLKLRDIDWNLGEIRIIQHKTQRPLILPLENNVGNAIVEYILNARPQSSSSNLFLRSRAPYEALRYGNGSAIVRRYAKRAGITWKQNEYKGFHSFRRSIGTNMLSADVPLSTISEVLGHSKTASTKPYLSTNMKALKMCPLPLNGFECVKEELR